MAQSVELLLDDSAEAAVRHQWSLLADHGLPSEGRGHPRPTQPHHRPHVTLYAAEAISETAEAALPALVAGLDLELQLASLLIFGPRRGRVILVRQVIPSVDLLRLQARVAVVCGADVRGQFGPGRWSPHVTLARRVPAGRLADMLAVLDGTADRLVPASVTACRRWDGTNKTAWLL